MSHIPANDRAYQHHKQLLGIVTELLDTSGLSPQSDVLDYGCGSMPYRGLFEARQLHYVGADIAPRDPGVELTLDDDGRIPLEAESFDMGVSTQVLEHVPEPQDYLGEARRVLRHGGKLMLSTHGLYRYHLDPTDYWRWTQDGLRLELERAGFRVVEMRSSFWLASVAVQLWQDAFLDRLPHALGSVHRFCCQSLIGLLERFHGDHFSGDAMVYVVLAEKV